MPVAKLVFPCTATFPRLMDACGVKQKSVTQAAAVLVQNMFCEVTAWSGGYVLLLLRDSLSPEAKSEVKVVACDVVQNFAKQFPESFVFEIEWVAHPVSVLTNDIKKEVQEKAKSAVTVAASCSGTQDPQRFSATDVKGQVVANNVHQCVGELASCVFVHSVEEAALAVIIPVFVRRLNARNVQTKRRCCVIIGNTSRRMSTPW